MIRRQERIAKKIFAIAKLDDQFRDGKISEKDYRTLRKEKKERLMKLYKDGKRNLYNY